jgi:hypothetical protein
MPDGLRSLRPDGAYPVQISDSLKRLAAAADRRLAREP